jgi:hypothetical protein
VPLDRSAMGRVLSALGNRVFVMHNVHEDAPEIFESRWAMSYLRGPLTRSQIKTLMDPRRTEFAQAGTPGTQAVPDAATARRDPRARLPPSRSSGEPRRSPGGGSQADSDPVATGRRPVLPPDIQQFFAPAPGVPLYTPMLLGSAAVRFADAKCGVDEVRDVLVVTPVEDTPVAVDWAKATDAEFGLDDLSRDPLDGASFADLPAAAQKAKSYAEWTKGFTAWLTRGQTLDLLRSPSLRVVSRPGENERDFRVRLQQSAREARDAQVAALRQKYAPKMQALVERERKAEQAVAREQEQVTSSRLQTGISMATTVFGAMFGRKTFSASTLGRATTAARGVGRSMKESEDVGRAQENVAGIQAQIQELEASLQADITATETAHVASADTLETLTLKPKRTGVQVKLVALVWVGQ